MLKRLRAFLSYASLLVLAVAWFVWLRPVGLGGPASYIIVSGISMEPTLYSGDLVILQAQEMYSVGDVVAFQVPAGNVIHRIVDQDGPNYILQGDNKDNIDPWTPQQGDILGSLWLHIPQLGDWIEKLQEPLWLAAFIAILCFILLL